MPKIRVYDSGVSANASPGGRRIPLSAGQSSLGELGRGLQQAGDILARKEERDSALLAEKELASARADWTRTLRDRQQTAAPGAPKFTDTFLGEFDTWRQDALEGMPTSRSRKLFDLGAERLRANLTGQASAFEATAFTQYAVKTTQQTLEDNINAVRADPTQLADVLEQNTRVVESLNIPGNKKAELTAWQSEQAAFAAVSGELDQVETVSDAEDIIQQLTQGKQWKQALSESGYAQSLRRAMVVKEQLGARDRKSFLDGFNEATRERKTGVDNRARMNPEIIAETGKELGLKPDAVQALQKQWKQADAVGEQTAWIVTASEAEINARARELRAKLQTPDAPGADNQFNEETEQAQAFQAALTQRNNAIKADRAGYVQHNSDKAKQLAARIASGDTAPETIEEYAQTLTAEQVRLGVPEDRVYLLNASQVQTLAQQMDQVDSTPEGAQKAYDTLIGWARTWGRHWPTVQRQLVEEKVLTGAAAVAASLTGVQDGQTGKQLLLAARIGDKQLKEAVDIPQLDATLTDATLATLADLRQTFDPQRVVGGAQAFANLAQAVRTLALFKLSRGETDVATAVQDAANRIVLNKYDIVGTYRVPRGVDTSTVSDAADWIQQHPTEAIGGVVAPTSLFLPGAPWERGDALSALRAGGAWVNNADNTGITLTWPDGQAVMRERNGTQEPVTFTWDQLEAQPRRGNHVRGRPFGRAYDRRE